MRAAQLSLWQRALRALLVVVLLSIILEEAEASNNWTRDLTSGRTIAAYPGVSIVPLLISCIDNHLSAKCGYRYLDRLGPLTLHGKFHSEGEFRPVVKYEVAIGMNIWRTTGELPKDECSATIKIDAGNPLVALTVNMDPFRPMIGKYRWGRIVLENGEAATISLDDLLPNGDAPEDADYKNSFIDKDSDRFGSSVSLVAVISLSKHLGGDFALVCRGKPCTMELDGERDSQGNFVPFVKLLAGNSEQSWQSLYESQKESGTKLTISNGKPTDTIRVTLDAYREVIGRMKFGKVIFSNGDFSVFEIDRLKPPFMSPPPPPD